METPTSDIDIPKEALDLKPPAFRYYLYILRKSAGTTGPYFCEPDREAVAELGLSLSTIRRSRRHLVELGFLRLITFSPRKDGPKNGANLYKIYRRRGRREALVYTTQPVPDRLTS